MSTTQEKDQTVRERIYQGHLAQLKLKGIEFPMDKYDAMAKAGIGRKAIDLYMRDGLIVHTPVMDEMKIRTWQTLKAIGLVRNFQVDKEEVKRKLEAGWITAERFPSIMLGRGMLADMARWSGATLPRKRAKRRMHEHAI